MSNSDTICGEGVIVETLPNGTVRVEMPNGYRALGYVSNKMRAAFGSFATGDKVMLEMTPYDLSQGRISGRR